MMNNDKRQERLVSLVRKLLELSRSNSNAQGENVAAIGHREEHTS
ncbi:TPA: hypothetical protein ACTEQ6_000926 [Klebsiella oxytoca]